MALQGKSIETRGALDFTADAEDKGADAARERLLHRRYHRVAGAGHVGIVAEIGLAIGHEHDVLRTDRIRGIRNVCAAA
jgi:hypothetical protein